MHVSVLQTTDNEFAPHLMIQKCPFLLKLRDNVPLSSIMFPFLCQYQSPILQYIIVISLLCNNISERGNTQTTICDTYRLQSCQSVTKYSFFFVSFSGSRFLVIRPNITLWLEQSQLQQPNITNTIDWVTIDAGHQTPLPTLCLENLTKS